MNPQQLDIKVIEDVAEAPVYRKPLYYAADIESCVVVARGTEGGNPTVDFIITDGHGTKYVAMLSGFLVEHLAGVIRGVRERTNDQ